MERLEDISEKNLLQAVINAVPAPIFYKDKEGRYLGGNKAFEAYIGLTLDQFVGRSVFELFDPELAEVYQNADNALMAEGGAQFYEAKVKYADGSLRDVEFHKAVFHAAEEEISGLVGVVLDVTERKQVQEQYQKLAFTDTLTSLSNRLAFQRDLEHAFLRSDRTGVPLVLLLLDLDDFKVVNDSYGHPVGDALLVEVARRLKAVVRKSDTVCRLGGDEFAILLEDAEDMSAVHAVTVNLLNAFSADVECCGLTLPLSTSIGVAVKGDQSPTMDDLMKNADIALYLAKGAGRNTVRWFQSSIKVSEWVSSPSP